MSGKKLTSPSFLMRSGGPLPSPPTASTIASSANPSSSSSEKTSDSSKFRSSNSSQGGRSAAGSRSFAFEAASSWISPPPPPPFYSFPQSAKKYHQVESVSEWTDDDERNSSVDDINEIVRATSIKSNKAGSSREQEYQSFENENGLEKKFWAGEHSSGRRKLI